MKLSQQDFMNANMIMPTHYPPGEGCGCSGCLTVFIVCAIISFISDHYKEILIILGIILGIVLAFFLIKALFISKRKENRQNKYTTFLKESKNVEANENDKDEKKSIKERRKEAREHDKQILKEREEKKKRRYKKKKNTDN